MPKSSIAMRTPSCLSRSRISQATRLSRSSAPSVISSISRSGSRPLSSSAWSDQAGELAMQELRGRQVDRHADARPGARRAGRPRAGRSRTAASSGRSPRRCARKSAGMTSPCSGWCQRSSASRPVTARGLGGDLRLIVEIELAMGERPPEVGLGRLAAPQLGVHRRARRSSSCRGRRTWRGAARCRRA